MLMDMSDAKICPILSVRTENCACVEEECALWLAGPQKCSLVFLGYKAMLGIQQMQKSSPRK